MGDGLFDGLFEEIMWLNERAQSPSSLFPHPTSLITEREECSRRKSDGCEERDEDRTTRLCPYYYSVF